MLVAGISVDVPTSGRPAVRLVVVDDSSGSPVIQATADFTGDDVPLPEQLHDAYESVRSRVSGASVERAVIRRADRPPKPSGKEGPKLRLLMEGAVTSAAKSVVIDTHLGTGKDFGDWIGSTKAKIESDAEALLSAQSLKKAYVEATGAAIVGLAL